MVALLTNEPQPLKETDLKSFKIYGKLVVIVGGIIGISFGKLEVMWIRQLVELVSEEGRRSHDQLVAGKISLGLLESFSGRIKKKEGRLLLFAEMKLPGEAWLEFKLSKDAAGKNKITQTATFRPHGFIW